MDKIVQYYKITNVKPEYYKLINPYYNSSKKKIIFNGKELELHYLDEFKIYVDKNDFNFKSGGSEQKIVCLNIQDNQDNQDIQDNQDN